MTITFNAIMLVLSYVFLIILWIVRRRLISLNSFNTFMSVGLGAIMGVFGSTIFVLQKKKCCLSISE